MFRKVLVCTLVLLVSSLASDARAQSTVRFETTAVTVAESAGSVTVNLVLDDPTNGGVIVQTFDGTATAPTDYAAVFDFVSWQFGDPAVQSYTIPIVSDGVTEPDETFVFRITSGDGANPGMPSEMTITISDAPPVPSAQFVLDDEIPAGADGQAHVFTEGGQDFSATVRLDQMPTSPVTVLVQVGSEPAPRSLLFDGVQERTLVVPSPPQPAGEPVARVPVSIQGSSQNGPFKFLGGILDLNFGFPADLDQCYLCTWSYLMVLAGLEFCDDLCILGDGCGAKATAMADPSSMPLLRRYRDEVLLSTSGGSYYEGVYRELSVEAFVAMTRDPGLAYAIYQARDPWIGAIQALVDGNGSSVVITAAMRDDLVAVLDRLSAAGSANLQQRLAEETSRLQLDGIDGLTMDQFQARVVAAGQSVAVEPTSWGDVKARFRN